MSNDFNENTLLSELFECVCEKTKSMMFIKFLINFLTEIEQPQLKKILIQKKKSLSQ
jgi:hypothetical protein